MNVYIQTDIEGIAGWISFEDTDTQTIENYQHRQRMYWLLTAEVNAAVTAAADCGAEKIYVNDSHNSGYNIIFEDLDPRCEIIHGRPNNLPAWLPSLDEGFDALVLVGMHAMGGELDGICPHSKWEVNGGQLYLSEGSMAMALAGDLNIPTVFASGDQVITSELRQKVPSIETAVVKHAYGPFCCRSLQPQKGRQLIYEGVKAGLGKHKQISPYKLDGPVTLNFLDSPGHNPPLKPALEEPVKADTITEAFNKVLDAGDWYKFGKKVMDHYRYPTNLSGKKPIDKS